jgi:Flp pilus assembly protein protease CpaA
MFGVFVAGSFLVVAAFFDLKTRGTSIPNVFLAVWCIAGILYVGYGAYALSILGWSWLRDLWLVSALVAFLTSLLMWRLRLAAEADCIGLTVTAMLTGLLGIAAFIIAAVVHAVLFGVLLSAINLRRHEKAIPAWALPFVVRLTPALRKLPFEWYRAYDNAGKLNLFRDLNSMSLDGEAGGFVMPLGVFLPFYAAAFAAAYSIPGLPSAIFGLSPDIFQWLMGGLP